MQLKFKQIMHLPVRKYEKQNQTKLAIPFYIIQWRTSVNLGLR